jgi:NADPH2:quinone reductase
VRIKVRAAAVNFPDLMQTRGEHQHKPTVPFVGGLELAGEVDALGGRHRLAGRRRGGLGGRGGFAEYAILPAATLRKKPATSASARRRLSGGLPHRLRGLSRCATRSPASGCWCTARPAASAWPPWTRPSCWAQGDRRLRLRREAGGHRGEYAADATVNVTGGFRERVKELTGGRGADVIYDPVGGDVFDESDPLHRLRRPHPLDRLHLGPAAGAAGQHRAHQGLLGAWRARRRIRPPVPRQGPREQRGHLGAGRSRPGETRVDAEYPLADWRAAFDTLATAR